MTLIQELDESEERGVLYFSVVGFKDKFWQYEREKEHGAMPKVGDTWHWENKVCGQWRYKDVV